MPQLNINVPSELWSALEIQGYERDDSPTGIVLSALSEYFDNNRDRLYQVSTSSALVEGVSEGALDVGTLRKYGDLVIGTFEHLDGEMVVVDGHVFQVRSDGSVRKWAMRFDMTVCLDKGSFHIWLARYLYSFRSRQVLISNGQQTMGVGLPWAIAASLVRPNEKVISISGDGGFMFSSMERETAVRLKCNLVHLVWMDGH